MEFQKITNFLDITSDNKDLPKFVTKKWIEVYNQSQGNYNVNKEIKIETSMLRSDLFHFNDAYIVNKNIAVTETDSAKNKRINKVVTFKNKAEFINCISKINGIKIDNAEDLDVLMAMYNLLEDSKNYRKTAGSLWNYYRDEPIDPLSSNSESFKYKTSITGNTCNIDEKITDNDGNEVDSPEYDGNKVDKNETEVVIRLKYLSNFWKSLNIPLINCELELILTWS